MALSITLDEARYADFERARAIVSRKHPAATTLAGVFEELVAFYLSHKAPKKREPAQAPTSRTRHVPAATRDHVMSRDGGRCTFVSSDGTRCNATHHAQIDHVVPFARGGSHDATNLRVLCGKHNRHRT